MVTVFVCKKCKSPNIEMNEFNVVCNNCNYVYWYKPKWYDPGIRSQGDVNLGW